MATGISGELVWMCLLTDGGANHCELFLIWRKNCISFDRCVKTDNSRSTETKVQPQFATSSELSQANVTMGTFSKDCDTDGLGLRRCKSAGDVSDFEESDSDRESDMEEYK